MLDLERIREIDLTGNPLGQKIVATCFLAPNYWVYPGVEIAFEGADNLPDEPVIYAMNHTDRYNYWPFQFRLWWSQQRFTATWVKGKYYQNPLLGKFMEWMNNIPTVSRGYLIARDFKNVLERDPTDEEYRLLRSLVDATAYRRDAEGPTEAELSRLPGEIFDTPRDMLGLDYKPPRHDYAGRLNTLFQAMMRRFVELNGEAFDKGLDLLVFPEGTRSKRLARGRIGLSQIALKFQRPVVPVGCNGSDQVYPGDSPVAEKGRIVYRIGEPVGPRQMQPYLPEEDYEPFTPAAETDHRERFQSFVDLVMGRINELLDPRYRASAETEAEAAKGASRFV